MSVAYGGNSGVGVLGCPAGKVELTNLKKLLHFEQKRIFLFYSRVTKFVLDVFDF